MAHTELLLRAVSAGLRTTPGFDALAAKMREISLALLGAGDPRFQAVAAKVREVGGLLDMDGPRFRVFDATARAIGGLFAVTLLAVGGPLDAASRRVDEALAADRRPRR
ncbi:MAG: hypothetical protein WA459_24775 [Stellaceae bacterium]